MWYDVVPLLHSDTRIQTLFTVDATSEFGAGVPEFLTSRGALVVPWEVARDRSRFDCDLTVSASANGNLHELPGPLLLMSHGAGHHKYLATDGGVDDTVAGLSRQQLIHDGTVVPAAIALGGNEQLARLRRECPEAVDRATVTGDICHQRLLASRPQRERYRRELELHEGQKLVLLSSTWGRDSLFGRYPRLAERLLSELPSDEFRFTAALHPNCWDRHGRPQVEGWLETARRAGLALIPPHEGWRAALIASDLVVADHGSVGFYGAAIGIPLALAAFGSDETPDDSPAAALARRAPRLDVDAPLESQIRAAMSDFDPHEVGAIVDETLDTKQDNGSRLRDRMYDLLRLDPPAAPYRPAPVELTEVDWKPVSALYHFPSMEDGFVALRQYPARVEPAEPRRPYRERILSVDASETDQRLWDAAAVLSWARPRLSVDEAARWAERELSTRRGAATAVAVLQDGRLLLALREYGVYLAHSRSRLEASSVGAAVHYLAVKGQVPGELRLRVADTNITVRLRPDAP
ncbi:MAG TPA: hypothetical protein VE172_12685 [Stackebrandtia sp.]|uniref:hypothetical protein n=1 Tax=Stackebrandtia sp. TaxID=2023065 RepID=UPI002D59621E|nr:hypothetical protein [Stackebrandtia sp.]HZE39658.1 hypothetical protein [Stackebrandtia sp.]